MKIPFVTACIATSLIAVSPALAHEQQGMDHSKMAMSDPANPYMQSEMDMHGRMMAAKTGDASEMWARKMIEHHRGAVAMSRVALAKASDAETRQMARMTIAMQEKDIAKLQGLLKAHGKHAQ